MTAARPPLGAGSAALALLLVSCVDFPLLDPADPEIPVVGASLTIERIDTLHTPRLEFEGYVYGHVERDGSTYRRFLEAGEVTVAGRSANRKYARPAEPVYHYAGPAAELPPVIRVRFAGSGALAPCELELRLPAVAWPGGGETIVRGRDLVLPLEVGSDSLPPHHRISAELSLTARAGFGTATTVSVDVPRVRSELVVPDRVLQALPAGRAALSVDLTWDRTLHGFGDARACVPKVLVRTTLRAERAVRLE